MSCTDVTSPTARPRQAPMVIVGRKIPAGTYKVLRIIIGVPPNDARTIIPNVHAVNPILTSAVSTRRNTFAQIAVGLSRYTVNVRFLMH